MTFFRLGLLAAATSLASCNIVTTAPEPPDFKLTPKALSQKFRATRKTGSVSLYANEIQTTKDEWGRETHKASGGALMVKETNPPILAQAESISITPEFSEALGQATVKKNDRLFIGQDDSTKIRIDGSEIILQGPVAIREVAKEDEAPKTTEDEKTEAAAPAPEKEAPKASTPPEPVQEKAKPKPVSKPKDTSRPPAKKPTPAKTTPPAKTSPPPAKPSSPPPAAAKPKAVPPVDRARLLNLMREPTDR